MTQNKNHQGFVNGPSLDYYYSKLTLTNVTSQDEGNYSCKVQNHGGISNYRNMTIRLMGKIVLLISHFGASQSPRDASKSRVSIPKVPRTTTRLLKYLAKTEYLFRPSSPNPFRAQGIHNTRHKQAHILQTCTAQFYSCGAIPQAH